jgi:hypothetical protein
MPNAAAYRHECGQLQCIYAASRICVSVIRTCGRGCHSGPGVRSLEERVRHAHPKVTISSHAITEKPEGARTSIRCGFAAGRRTICGFETATAVSAVTVEIRAATRTVSSGGLRFSSLSKCGGSRTCSCFSFGALQHAGRTSGAGTGVAGPGIMQQGAVLGLSSSATVQHGGPICAAAGEAATSVTKRAAKESMRSRMGKLPIQPSPLFNLTLDLTDREATSRDSSRKSPYHSAQVCAGSSHVAPGCTFSSRPWQKYPLYQPQTPAIALVAVPKMVARFSPSA